MTGFINTNASSNGGWWWWGGGGNADSVGIDNNSSISTGAGNDSVVVNSFASGANTNAWAIRDSSIDVGSGDDYVSLNATTFQTQRR